MMQTTTHEDLKPIDAQTLYKWLADGEAVLVDVREPVEHAGEHIPGAHLLPLSKFDPVQVPQEPGKKLVLHCLTGNRSAQAARKWLEADKGPVWHLQGGLQAWKAAGYSTEQSARAPLSLQRQVQIVAGSLVFLGTVLGAFVSPWCLLLSGFVGAGLMFAGITDTCGMAMLLAKLPYNQRTITPR
jgi:rhodanese-related sulfurtransferase